MNILIVGNGFDLSHYLPTKYDHFMDVMRAIEESESDSMNFDELFSRCREERFIAKTKEYYFTENIILEEVELEEIQGLLKENCWYKYFKNHIKQIDTWIDFENRIEELLISFADFLECSNGSKSVSYDKSCRNLSLFKLFVHQPSNRTISNGIDLGSRTNKAEIIFLNSEFCFREKLENGFSALSFVKFLQKELDEFIQLFNFYLANVIDQLNSKRKFTIALQTDHIFSFNYTDTYRRIYDDIEIDYLHGACGLNHNMVLGISDLEDEALKKLKAYGFTKYHQKLFKDTDYLFLDDYKSKIIENNKKLEIFEREKTERERQAYRESMTLSSHLNLNITIWGHSLDISDRDYILDLFSLNDDMDRNVRVKVYYFDKQAKFSLLNNLLAILDKDKVEKWMKKGWLKFEKNPKIDFGIEQQSLEQEAS